MEAGPSLPQRAAMELTERLMSCFSVVGIFFIFGTYLFSPLFRKPINRLVFFASFGNLGMNIASLIGEKGPAGGANSVICQVQGFMVQMFLGVDAYWSLCMAINVYLIFFGHFNTNQLRRMDIGYIFACYGLALIPSIVFLFVTTPEGRLYGDAVLWCWLQDDWSVLRIGLVYSISWIAVTLALAVYGMAAVNVYKRRDELQPGFMNPLNDAPLKSTVTTEIIVTVESAKDADIVGSPTSLNFSADPDSHMPGADIESGGHYRVAIEAPEDSNARGRQGVNLRQLTRTAAEYDANTDALLYARAAFFYFIALLIIWLPSSANRAWAVAHPGQYSFPINYMSCLLLSAQGTLNVVVYMITSREPMKHLFVQLGLRKAPAAHRGDPSEEQIEIVCPRWNNKAIDSASSTDGEGQWGTADKS